MRAQVTLSVHLLCKVIPLISLQLLHYPTLFHHFVGVEVHYSSFQKVKHWNLDINGY